MIKASVAYEMMEKALHLIPSHESTSTYLSAYGVFNLESGDCVAVRAANHGTFLYNWLKMQDEPFNVDLLTSANVALTFLDGSIPFSHNNNIEMDNGAEPPVFVVRQYVYNCAVLDANDINVIISASKKLIIDGVYTDPFEEDSTKHAIIYREKTNEPSKDMTAKTLKKHRAAKKKRELQQPTDNNNQELNTEQYMNKKLIRLTEGDLHRIVKESVNMVLNERTASYYEVAMSILHAMIKALGSNDINYLCQLNTYLQDKINALQQQQQPMQQPQQPQGIQQQPMQQPQQAQPMQPQGQQPMQQPFSTNNNSMIDNQVQQQMQRNMALQQQMANRIRQQKMAKYNQNY